MNRLLSLLCLAYMLTASVYSQVENPYQSFFSEAYRAYPGIPEGVLEAIAYTNTRFHHLEAEPSCQGLPQYVGVMGLVEDGKGYFQNSLQRVAQLSGYSASAIKSDPRTSILAYAAAYNALQQTKRVARTADAHRPILAELSEIPTDNSVHNEFALDQQFYSVLREMENPHDNAQRRTRPTFDYNRIFGSGNYEILSAPALQISGNRIADNQNRTFRTVAGTPDCTASKDKTDYASATWVAANTRNYGSRDGKPVELITIHTIQGSYASAISWFKNPNARVSAHYIIRASDGQVTQMVCEDDKAYHVRKDNGSTIGIEHEGFIDDGLSWYTPEMYESSARLVRDIADRHNINLLKTYGGPPTTGVKTLTNTCYLVKGHQHFRENTHIDPGPYWDWDRYYRLINGEPAPLVFTSKKGELFDPGAESENYGDLQRVTYLIRPENATEVRLKFKEWELEGSAETPYDYLDIYDGTNNDGKYLGRFTGSQKPADLVCKTGSAYIEFRSDCRVNKKGWRIEYTSSRKASDCGPPDGVVSSNLFPAGATVSWNSVPGANQYLVYVRRKNLEPKWTLYKTRNTSVTMTGLGASGLYQYQVQAVCGNDTSALVGSNFTTPAISRKGAPQVYTIRLNRGRFFDSGGGASGYLDEEAYLYTILPPNGGKVELKFSEFDTEEGEDILAIYDGTSDNAPLLGSFSGQQVPPVIRSTGSAMTIRFLSDPRITGKGWRASWKTIGGSTTPPVVNNPNTGGNTGGGNSNPPPAELVANIAYASTSPVTSAELRGAYQESFLLSFADEDKSGRGLANRFYTLAQETSNGWWANTAKGYFYDDFESGLNPNWKQVTGDWVVSNGVLVQRDEQATNSNLYAPLTQRGDKTYIYHWTARLDGAGGNKRAGLHFFCSEPARSNRGNSYFIWAREANSGDRVEIYEVRNNAFSMKASKAYNFEPGQAYDFKTIYNPRKGRIEVYLNNRFLLSWVDSSPLKSGKAISLRTGSSATAFDQLRVYQARKATLQVGVGRSENDDLLSPGYKGRGAAFRALSLIVDRNIRWSRVTTASSRIGNGSSASSGGATNPTRPDPELGGNNSGTDVSANSLLAPSYSRDFSLNLGRPEMARAFYLVGGYDGRMWQANTNAGLLLDEFDGSQTNLRWVASVGDWISRDGVLQQSNSSATNSNMYMALDQNSDAVYLYHFKARILSRGNNKRFGIHFFCSNAEQTNRGDSYMIWFRNHDNKRDNLELYRSAGNQLSRILVERPISLEPERWVDCKIVYAPGAGLIEIYMDNQRIIDWRDPQGGLRFGRFVSLRTGSSQVQFDDIRVYQLAEGNRVEVGIGKRDSDLAQFKSIGTHPAMRLYTLYQDRTGRWMDLRIEEARIE